MTNTFKYILIISTVFVVTLFSFYYYVGYQFKKVLVETSFNMVEFVSQEKSKKVFVCENDTLKASFGKPPFSIFINELKNSDTISIIIVK